MGCLLFGPLVNHQVSEDRYGYDTQAEDDARQRDVLQPPEVIVFADLKLHVYKLHATSDV
ncbi:MAG TPA: hypothetical protein VJW23_01040 [Propionibacteriaceae bacterium]|nr:hypothetical protein [Propionibacteriaceae bacterium]